MGGTMIVRNAMSRPVEIHLSGGVTVMLPGDKLELDQAVISGPGVRPLVQSGALSCFQAPPEPAGRPPRARKRASEKAPAEKTGAAATKAAARKKGKRSPPRPDPAEGPRFHGAQPPDTDQATPAPDGAEPHGDSR